MKDPETEREWQDAVDAAKGALALESARTYGLVTGGPDVDVRRCNIILGRGASRRPPVLPSVDAVERFLEGHWMGVKLALVPQDIDALKFRDRDYLDVEHLARALSAWAEQADAAGATAQAVAFRDIREILVKPIRTRAVGEVEVQVET